MPLHHLVAAVTISVLLLTGCSATTEDPAPSGAPEAAAPEPPAPVADVEVTAGPGPSTGCFDTIDRDYFWFDPQIKVRDDLDPHTDLTVKLTLEAEGAKVIGRPHLFAPVNFGGRIDYSGLITWKGRRHLLKSRLLGGGQSFFETDEDWVPLPDANMLVGFRIRFDDDVVAGKKVANFTAVSAHTAPRTTPEDAQPVTSVPIDEHWATGRACADLPEIQGL